MNDYNSGALPDPCLRLDYGFGDDWKSVELGDGTGYVRLADYEKVAGENDKLREERDEWHRVAVSKQDIIDHMRDARGENTKLWELVSCLLTCANDTSDCDRCPLNGGEGDWDSEDFCDGLLDCLRELRFEVGE